jgi:DeoR family deoxyribose operon repressor
LAQHGTLHLKEAAELLGVSEMTVRRDVGSAAGRFVYLGAHIFLPPAPKHYQMDTEAAELTSAKREACRHAMALVQPGSTIFIDSGTTLQHLADLLPATLDVTVVTNSLNVASRIGQKAGPRLVLLGGLYQPASDSFTFEGRHELLEGIGINIAFLSAGGLDWVRGASCYQFHELAIKKQVLASAVESHLVIDSSKVGQIQPAFFARASDFRTIISETGLLEPH